jgi:hypothetical protein
MSIKAGNIFVPTFGISLIILFMIIFVWKRFSRSRRPIIPCNNSQLAFITQKYHQQQPYQTAWPPPPVEEPPPSYYTVMSTATVPPSVSLMKQ